MCWNEHVSLNTFLFSTFALGMIYYSNEYTPYKIPEIQGWGYLFLFSFIIMQLNEYFLWKSIQKKDTKYNRTFSISGLAIILFQPFAAIQTLPTIYDFYKYILSCGYVVGITGLYLYKSMSHPVKFQTTVNKHKSLNWDWIEFENIYETMCFYILYLIGMCMIYFQLPTVFFIGIFWYLIVQIFQFGYFASLWCLLVNTVLLFYLFQILFYLPLMKGRMSSFTRVIVK